MKRVNKRIARKTYNDGKPVTIAPCKANLYNPWIAGGCVISKTNGDTDGRTFDQFINEFEYYNCNYELGYYASYYINEEENEQ